MQITIVKFLMMIVDVKNCFFIIVLWKKILDISWLKKIKPNAHTHIHAYVYSQILIHIVVCWVICIYFFFCCYWWYCRCSVLCNFNKMLPVVYIVLPAIKHSFKVIIIIIIIITIISNNVTTAYNEME